MKNKTIWIDLDNSPHVPFFKPIIEELWKRGYFVVLTARECAQTCELADRNGFRYERIGRHFGKNKALKVAGLLFRCLELMPFAMRSKPDLALSHGSRAQVLSATLLGIPSVWIIDYEFVQFMKPTWVILPEIIPEEAVRFGARQVFRYPGIKEDVYVPGFAPDPSILEELGLDTRGLVVTIRPPATQAHYHNPQAEILFDALVERFGKLDALQMVLLPRDKSQEQEIKKKWPGFVSGGKILFPGHAVDGLNLIWYSDFVVSGGGTMNREAAALGVPVYSIFRGQIGAVDRYLAEKGKLVLIESVEDIRSKIALEKRAIPARTGSDRNGTLECIVETIDSLLAKDLARG